MDTHLDASRHDGAAVLRERLLASRLHEPLALLGLHREDSGWTYRAWVPGARAVWLLATAGWVPMRAAGGGLFVTRCAEPPPRPHRLRAADVGGEREFFDPYGFAPSIGDFDLHLFGSGRLLQAYRIFGAQRMTIDGVDGVRFAVWAPNAERVSVVGDFNRWDGRCHPMQVRGTSGVWELFVPGLPDGMLYKFEIRHRESGLVFLKTDPYGRDFELRPGTAARVAGPAAHAWSDDQWLAQRQRRDWRHAPMSIYEVHTGSWRRPAGGGFLRWAELAAQLVPYAAGLGFTHLELMPITEHPLDESWGYQSTGFFAPTRRHGTADELRAFVDACHGAGLGVLLDWVPGHFPADAFALAHFDGTALYEHEDPRLGVHPDWGTRVFNYGRAEVRSFLLSSAHYWLDEFHFDGLRVDAVASMLYLDYSRKPGQWLPNRYGGRENLEAIDFLRELNVMVHERFPGAVTIAEESTAWPMVSRPTYVGGLGFSMKWNMGWMHDTLEYMRRDPVHRRYHHELLTLGQLYAYTENFVLPLSHDEVVHGKGSLVGKMPGDAWQRHANLRLLATYQMTYPGKKLLFMGGEFGQPSEWNAAGELDWNHPLHEPLASGMQRLTGALLHLYRDTPALHELDFDAEGFRWLDCHDADHSVIAYLRRARNGHSMVVVLNFTPVPRHGYRIGVPRGGWYAERFNSDSRYFGGSDLGNAGGVDAEPVAWGEHAWSLSLTLPPLAGLIFECPP